MRQCLCGHLNRSDRLKLIATMAMLTVQVMPTLVQAQPGEYRFSDGPEWCAATASQEGCGVSAAETGIGFNAQLTSDEPEGTVRSGASAGILHADWPAALVNFCAGSTRCADWFISSPRSLYPVAQRAPGASDSSKFDEGSKPTSGIVVRTLRPVDSDHNFFYKNKLEFSLESGWLPINIPFVFDVFLGDGYTMTDLKYTLAPIIASVRWQTGDVKGPLILRGNWDLEASAAAVVIPRGPETRYFAFILGFRRNFVPGRGRFAPYFDGRLGLGEINAKEPLGVLYAQGQNFTFTMNMGSGVRYNISPRYAIWSGLNWMHISNLYLSQPQFANYGINVYGPMFGIDARVGRLRLHHHAAE